MKEKYDKESCDWDKYFFSHIHVMKNKLNIFNQHKLDKYEKHLVAYKMQIADQVMDISYSKEFSVERLLALHDFLFGDIYEWAGTIRDVDIYKNEKILNGRSVDYPDKEQIPACLKHIMRNLNSPLWDEVDEETKLQGWTQSLAELWQTHAFREGNTRTSVVFCLQFAGAVALNLNNEYFYNHSKELRDALCLYADGHEENLNSFVAHAFNQETLQNVSLHEELNKGEVKGEQQSFIEFRENVTEWIDGLDLELNKNNLLKLNIEVIMKKMMDFYKESIFNKNEEIIVFKNICDQIIEGSRDSIENEEEAYL